MSEFELQWLVGTKQLKPLTYWLEEKLIKRRFWFDKKEYYVVCEYCRIGPMTLEEANIQIGIARSV